MGATLAQQCAHKKYKGHLRPIAFMPRKMQPAGTRYPIREQELLAIVPALKQWFHLLRGPPQVHEHTDHESLRYLKTCPRPLMPRQARWSQVLDEYNLTLWYVPRLENSAADACSRLTSRQIISDRHKLFKSQAWKGLAHRFRIKMHQTVASRPRGNGQAERSNQSILQRLRTDGIFGNNEWDVNL